MNLLPLTLIFHFLNQNAVALAQTPQPHLTTHQENAQSLYPPVSGLRDVDSTHWAYSALQSLLERYSGVIAGYPDGTFRGNRTLTRYEFAAALRVALDRINELIANGTQDAVSQDDLLTLQRLHQEFATELETLRKRVDVLEARSAELETNQFSTTTKLQGQIIMALNAGAFDGQRIIAPRGAVIAEDDPNPTFIYRASLDFNTSFQGSDLLKIRLVTGSDGANDSATGFLEPNFGSVLDYSIQGRNNQFSLARLYYTFAPTKDLKVTVGPAMVAPDFVDKNRYANISFRDFSTQSFTNNFILLPRPGGGGAVIDWNPGGGAVKLRALYVAGDATNNLSENQRLIGGGAPENIRLFPTAGGGADGGLFGDPYQGFVELEYAPSQALSVRLQYSGGKVFGSSFQGVGVNFDLALSKQLGIFGRYGYASYPNTSLGDIEPNYWVAGIAFPDLFAKGGLMGLAVGQPFIESNVGNATQTNYEIFYNIPVNDNIRVTPLLQVVTHPSNQNANGTIFSGTLRTVFSF
ncbi:iron uptake porin [Tolypothrix bouteillei VB521301]|uniref:Iron uptake porin n=1 Tax=Tolypothrix bouteillei VB521301 TaxID=1479485 RepID=A0A8S9TLT4_9CYAN|nr:iron uptake porin [Tolypothrix bouteillei VB521301]